MSEQLQLRRGTASQVAAFTGAQGEVVVDSTNNRLVVQDGATAGGFAAARLNELLAQPLGFALQGGQLVASVASNNLTVAVKTIAGADPTPASPVTVTFRDAALAGGNQNPVAITAATSFTVNSGNGLGTANGVPFRLWVVGFNDAGAFRLGLINCVVGAASPTQIFPLLESMLQSSTGGNGGASAATFYTGTAVAAKALRILGYLEYASGLSTAGAWTSAPTTVHLLGPGGRKPGDIVQVVYATISTTTSSTSASFAATSATANITPTAACNLIEARATGAAAGTTNQAVELKLMRNGGAAQVGISAQIFANNSAISAVQEVGGFDAPQTTSSIDYTVYMANGNTGAGACFFPQSSFSNPRGAITIKEYMA